MAELPHFDPAGHVHLVDVGSKPVTPRMARAVGRVEMQPETMARIRERDVAKGDVLELARVAGIMASKRTSDLIPLCHPLVLDAVTVDIEVLSETTLKVTATVSAQQRTGVEMEALVAVSAACLTIYDMCKSMDRGMTLGPYQLMEKSGGKSGHFVRSQQP